MFEKLHPQKTGGVIIYACTNIIDKILALVELYAGYLTALVIHDPI